MLTSLIDQYMPQAGTTVQTVCCIIDFRVVYKVTFTFKAPMETQIGITCMENFTIHCTTICTSNFCREWLLGVRYNLHGTHSRLSSMSISTVSCGNLNFVLQIQCRILPTRFILILFLFVCFCLCCPPPTQSGAGDMEMPGVRPSVRPRCVVSALRFLFVDQLISNLHTKALYQESLA